MPFHSGEWDVRFWLLSYAADHALASGATPVSMLNRLIAGTKTAPGAEKPDPLHCSADRR
jgi:hypothetical protein